MSDNLLETEHFGFTRLGEGEPLSKNGWSLTDANMVALDDILYALENHTHSTAGRLQDPVGAPTLSTVTNGGILPPDTTFYYLVSYVDQWGLETASSIEADITTPIQVVAPTGPSVSVEGSSGSLQAGVYLYSLTAITSGGGETTGSSAMQVRITSGSSNRVLLEMPDMPTGAVAFRVYRSRPGQSQIYYLTQTDVDIYDDGSLTEDTSITLPGYNSTNATTGVEVTVPGGLFPTGTVAWRLYRSTEPGIYDGFNFIGEISDKEAPGDEFPITAFIDNGETLLQGQPREVSSTISGGQSAYIGGISGGSSDGVTLPIALMPRSARSLSLYVPTVEIGKTYLKFDAEEEIFPVQMAGLFMGTEPVTDTDGAQVGFEMIDEDGNSFSFGTDGVANDYITGRYPKTIVGTFEAEQSIQDNFETLIVSNDTAASGNQAVDLSEAATYVEGNLGTLDPGKYYGKVRLRAWSYTLETPTTPVAEDIRISFTRSDTNATLYTGDFTVKVQAANAYYEIGEIPFEIPSGVGVIARVTKVTSSADCYRIDNFGYEVQKAPLQPGTITIRGTLVDYPTASQPAYAPPPASNHFDAPLRIYAREGIETDASFTFATSAGGSVAWTIDSDQVWCVPTPDGATNAGATISCAIDFDALDVGGRGLATITIAGAGYASCALEVVALRAPTVLGDSCNLMITY